MNIQKLERTLLTVREAAAFLVLSERKVWSITAPRGDLPAVRINRSIRYSITDLESFIDRCRVGGQRDGGVE